MKLSNKKKIELIKEIIKRQRTEFNFGYLKAYNKIVEVIEK